MIIGSVVRHYEKVSSTNTVASEMLREEKPAEGTVITASFQESGKGQAGNKWESEPDTNLLMSIILYPVMVKPCEQFILSQMVSLAVYDLVTLYTEKVAIKWPNDVYVKDDKIAGILLENSIMGDNITGTVAGLGLNLNQTCFKSDAPNPVSLRQLTGDIYSLKEITEKLITLLDNRYSMIIRGRTAGLAADYQKALYRAGEWHSYHDKNGTFKGMIEKAKSDGMLVVRRKNGSLREYAFKEIDYIL